MKYTSAGAAKLVRRLLDEQKTIKDIEKKASVFVAATDEKLEDARPEYDYAGTQAKLNELEKELRRVKHAINIFNITTTVPGFDMTVDQLLVYIPQLTERKKKLEEMAARLPKEREESYSSKKTEYSYANYDVKQAQKELLEVTDELSRAQTALDVVNNNETLELE